MTANPYDRQLELMYKRWLVERVLVHGESTLQCAKHINADPEVVRRDFEAAMGKDWQAVVGPMRRRRRD